jgi:hypothetical protein
MGVVFDKLAFMRRLEVDGTFTRPQAEQLSEAFHQAVSESVATKQDIESLRGEMATLGAELRGEIATQGADLRREMAELKVWIVVTGASLFGLLTAIRFLVK